MSEPMSNERQPDVLLGIKLLLLLNEANEYITEYQYREGDYQKRQAMEKWLERFKTLTKQFKSL